MKKEKLRTMEAASKKAKPTTSQGKLLYFQEQSDLAFTLLVKSQVQENPLDLQEYFTYSLAHGSHCLGTPDRFLNKASMLHFLMKECLLRIEIHHFTLLLAWHPPLEVYRYRF